MRFSTAVSSALFGVVLAAPVAEPQDFDFDAYDAVPYAPEVAAPVALAPDTATYNAQAAIATAVADAIGGGITKRGSCLAQPAGNYPAVIPDTAEAFVVDPTITAISNGAATPPGYFLVDGFKNLDASASDSTYITYISSPLTSYDPAVCAAKCTSISGCVTFNIYFERDPTIYLDKTACPTAASLTRIKCAFFGAPLTIASATNIGQFQDSFHIVQAGSNAYTTAPQQIPGFTGPVSLGDATINAPTADGTYMGVQTFDQTQPFDPSVCAAACQEKTAYNLRHAVPGGPAPRVCRFFDAYILYKDGANGVFTCSYYTQAYGPAFATNFGQTRPSGKYTPGHSYTYTLI